MKTVLQALAFLFASCALASAQTGPAGTWQAQGAPWAIELKLDSGVLTGAVTQNNGVGTPISDGRVDGNTVTFKVTTASGGVISFIGKLSGDEMAFTREAKFPGAAGPGEFALLGPGEPKEFAMNRTQTAASWSGTIRNAPTRRNANPNPNPRAVSLGVKQVATPHWRWRGGDKQTEVYTFTLPMGSFELSSFELKDDKLSYSYSRPNQNDEIRCDLARQPSGKFTGRCDSSTVAGFSVLIELTPPAPATQK